MSLISAAHRGVTEVIKPPKDAPYTEAIFLGLATLLKGVAYSRATKFHFLSHKERKYLLKKVVNLDFNT